MRYADEPETDDQGFCKHQQQPLLLLPRPAFQFDSNLSGQSAQFNRSMSKEPNVRIKLLNINSSNVQFFRDKYKRSRDMIESSDREPDSYEFSSTNARMLKPIGSPRKVIQRESIEFEEELNDLNKTKQILAKEGVKIVFQETPHRNTHSFINMITSSVRQQCFLSSRFNSDLKRKISRLAQQHGEEQFDSNGIKFKNRFESANLAFATLINACQYDLYIRMDTNTRGHQNWFNFKVQSNQSRKIKFNICNIRRQFSLYTKGLKPFVYTSKMKKWEQTGENIVYSERPMSQHKLYCLSFRLELIEFEQYHIAMLPTYTYSEMLSELHQLESDKKIQLENLGMTLTGLAIPLVTIEDKTIESTQKNVILLTCRIHPGQTVSSFILRGIIYELVEQTEMCKQLLRTTVIKIIPMMNPDGVVFGNFRTSMFGVDLNRCFNKDDEILYPEVVILKRYGYFLKEKFKERFICYFDLHGHSTKKNVFVYGPQYPLSMTQYYQCRMIPKIFDKNCKYFRYHSSSFKLDEQKTHTARGYFLKTIKVMAYTLESSYGLYDEEGLTKLFRVDDWIECGRNLIQALSEYIELHKYTKVESPRSPPKTMLDKLDKLKKYERLEKQKEKYIIVNNLKIAIDKQQNHIIYAKNRKRQVNSDSQTEDQDYTPKEKQKLQRKLYLMMQPTIFPKVERQQILYPIRTPSLLDMEDPKCETKIKFNRPRKGYSMRSNAQRRIKIIKHLQKLQLLKPNSRNIPLSYAN